MVSAVPGYVFYRTRKNLLLFGVLNFKVIYPHRHYFVQTMFLEHGKFYYDFIGSIMELIPIFLGFIISLHFILVFL